MQIFLKIELKAANFTNETVTQKKLNKKYKLVPYLKTETTLLKFELKAANFTNVHSL